MWVFIRRLNIHAALNGQITVYTHVLHILANLQPHNIGYIDNNPSFRSGCSRFSCFSDRWGWIGRSIDSSVGLPS